MKSKIAQDEEQCDEVENVVADQAFSEVCIYRTKSQVVEKVTGGNDKTEQGTSSRPNVNGCPIFLVEQSQTFTTSKHCYRPDASQRKQKFPLKNIGGEDLEIDRTN